MKLANQVNVIIEGKETYQIWYKMDKKWGKLGKLLPKDKAEKELKVLKELLVSLGIKPANGKMLLSSQKYYEEPKE